MPVTIPNDRTQKQPVKCACYNPECLEDSSHERFEFTFEHGQVACPKCGATEPPIISVMSLTHLLHRNKSGKIVGAGGLRFSLACDHNRAYLATRTNLEAATDQVQFVNCPGCLEANFQRQLATATM